MGQYRVSCGPLSLSDPEYARHKTAAELIVAGRLGRFYMSRFPPRTQFRVIIRVRGTRTDKVDIVGTAYTGLRGPGRLVVNGH